ncbi:heme-binding beta-barrel domain-containing protein [Anaeromyxobacter sp. Red801]|uniref:heme-binding beta-barrel domain-containing protein n=1 Tax=Anaeromyxobacter sp. Red801 TaxID=3411632 RepID=UPI003BA08DC0
MAHARPELDPRDVVAPGADIFTEPEEIDPLTLRNLGPLAPLAGTWEGRGVDRHPVAEGVEESPYVERIVFEPIDPQPNGPQLLYGLRYHQRVQEPDDPATFHDQVGYWLWEPATHRIVQSLAIPRAQVALAGGVAAPDARAFTVNAVRGSAMFGICSGPFLEQAFTTLEYTLTFTVHDDGSLSYEQDTVLRVRGREEPFHHTDASTLRRVAAPMLNPSAAAEGTGPPGAGR